MCFTLPPEDPPLSADPTKLAVLFGSLGAPSGALLLFGFELAIRFVWLFGGTFCYPDLNFSLLLGTSVITACPADLKLGVHQHSDCGLLLATFVLTTCYTDLKPGVHQHSDFALLLATFEITACYSDLKQI